ncbi:hypothetical protein EDD35_2271 [Amycolatopsis thermoflava]|uniref:Uncharacterized protein n=1 Tax=Amycolatopsis thermoflava TaxID=84480 RepID=A0A3N2GUL1_9PSEU|nr:hypothetical protein EDD35_2271 [Amycolatopsis thermoflava]
MPPQPSATRCAPRKARSGVGFERPRDQPRCSKPRLSIAPATAPLPSALQRGDQQRRPQPCIWMSPATGGAAHSRRSQQPGQHQHRPHSASRQSPATGGAARPPAAPRTAVDPGKPRHRPHRPQPSIPATRPTPTPPSAGIPAIPGHRRRRAATGGAAHSRRFRQAPSQAPPPSAVDPGNPADSNTALSHASRVSPAHRSRHPQPWISASPATARRPQPWPGKPGNGPAALNPSSRHPRIPASRHPDQQQHRGQLWIPASPATDPPPSALHLGSPANGPASLGRASRQPSQRPGRPQPCTRQSRPTAAMPSPTEDPGPPRPRRSE